MSGGEAENERRAHIVGTPRLICLCRYSDHTMLEEHHGWVQWVFPTDEESAYVPPPPPVPGRLAFCPWRVCNPYPHVYYYNSSCPAPKPLKQYCEVLDTQGPGIRRTSLPQVDSMVWKVP